MTEIDLTIPPILDRRGETKKPLILSYTLLNTYRNICKHQAYRRFIRKDVPYKSTPEMEWGDTVHKALELRVGGGKPLPQNMHQWERFAAPLYASKAKAEMKAGMTVGGHPCGFFADDVWLRGKLDINIVNGTSAFLFDYKTSKKPREDPFELEIQGLLLNALHPQLKTITGCYIWLAENRVGTKHDVSHTRDTFTYVQRIAADLAEDMTNQEFEKQPTPLCGWCGVLDCEHRKERT